MISSSHSGVFSFVASLSCGGRDWPLDAWGRVEEKWGVGLIDGGY